MTGRDSGHAGPQGPSAKTPLALFAARLSDMIGAGALQKRFPPAGAADPVPPIHAVRYLISPAAGWIETVVGDVEHIYRRGTSGEAQCCGAGGAGERRLSGRVTRFCPTRTATSCARTAYIPTQKGHGVGGGARAPGVPLRRRGIIVDSDTPAPAGVLFYGLPRARPQFAKISTTL